MIPMGRRILGKRAVSPVISTLLMVGIIFAMFAIIYPWAFSSLTLSESIANIWYSSHEEAAKERFSIEMVVFRNESGITYIDAYVRNLGEVEINVTRIYINVSAQTTVDPALPKTIYVSVSGVENVECFSITYPWTNGETYRIKVITARGEQAISEASAPL